MPKALYTPPTSRNLADLYRYIAGEASPAVGERILRKVLGDCDLLADFPRMGRRAPEFDLLGLEIRLWHTCGYAVFYAEVERGAQVLRILHHSRDIGPEVLDFYFDPQ